MTGSQSLTPGFEMDGLRRAHAATRDLARETPVFTSRTLSASTGGAIVLKAENLQRTGSFKVRGAAQKLLADSLTGYSGVVAGSAGNHAQALAFAAKAAQVPCTVFMPTGASVSKVAAVRGYGAVVELGGLSVDECVQRARQRADERHELFVHPFDDPEIVRGQAGVGLELLDRVPDLATVVVPVGGGGLAAGVALAVKQGRPDVKVVGVRTTMPAGSTLADGIAIKYPGMITSALLGRWLDDLTTVDDTAVADAMVFLLERVKLVVEGGGAAGVAALLAGAVKPAARGTTAVVLSGGNVDASVLSSVLAHRENRAGRRVRLFARITDRPGGLAGLLQAVADAGANVLNVVHVREGIDLPFGQTGVELIVEVRDEAHSQILRDRFEARAIP